MTNVIGLIPLAQVSWGLFAGLLLAVIAAAVTAVIILERVRRTEAEEKSREIIERAEQEAERIAKEAAVEAKEELFKNRARFEEESKETRQELRELQRQLAKREDNLDNKNEILQKKEKYVEDLEKDLAERLRTVAGREKELAALIGKEKDELYKIANMSRDEAVELLLKRLEDEVDKEADQVIRRAIERIQDEKEKQAQKIVMTAISRCAVEHTADSVVSTVDLPNDDMKGRIIGREGRNIRAFEQATGVDVIVDDTPGVIVVSGFDGVRRETARRAMEKLIQDGRIHPGRIEEVVDRCRKEVEEVMKQTGRETAADLDVHGLKAETIQCLGRLKYRTSYGQNVLQHSIESAKLAAGLAGELDLDTALARRIGLLHDIGKAVDHDMEGGHPEIGADMARRWGEDAVVVNAIAAHHEDCPAETIYAVLAQTADAISASRPGARRESLERYIKRLQKLENIANSFSGVDTTYAIQAGREVRVIVKSDEVADNELGVLARKVATEIENELAYPGEIKVTVLRETRSIEYAK